MCLILSPVFAQMYVQISPSTAQTIDKGQSVVFNGTAYQGSGNYVYQWYNNSAPVSGATNHLWTFTPGYTGSYKVFLWVYDNNLKEQKNSTTVTVTVNPALSLTISPSTATKDFGQPISFNANVTGGTKPYTATSWYWNFTYSGPSNSSSWIFTPPYVGHYNVSCQVLDGSSVAGNYPRLQKNSWLTVNAPPFVTVSPTSGTMDVGQSQTFVSSVSSGTPPYSYQWYLNGVAQGTSSTWTFTPSSSGSNSVYLNVTDSATFKVKSNVVTITVNAVPSVSTSPYNGTWILNQPLTFTETVAGGTSPYTYYWGCGLTASQAYSNMGNNGPTGSSKWNFIFNAVGNWIVMCNVFDSAKGTPILGPWGSTAYVNVVNASFLQLSANATLPSPGVNFVVKNSTGMVVYNGGVGNLLLPNTGNYNITVSPTYKVEYIGYGRNRYVVTFQFVGWTNGTGSPAPIISTSNPITIPLNQPTIATLIADYYVTATGGNQN